MRRSLVVAILMSPLVACDGTGNEEIASARQPHHLPPDRARALLAAQLRAGETLREAVPHTFALTGQAVAVGVAVSADGARRFEVDDEGRPVSLEMLAALEADAQRLRYGKMTQALYDRQRELPDELPLEFLVYVQSSPTMPVLPYLAPDQLVPVAELTRDIRAHRARVADELSEAKAALLSWLAAEGATLDDHASLPMVRVIAPVRVLRSPRLTEDDVAGLDIADTSDSQRLGYAGHASMREASLVGGVCGGRCDGGGLSVGIWEFNGANFPVVGAIATDNSRLWTASTETYFQPPTTCSTDAQCPWDRLTAVPLKCHGGRCVDEHLSTVAGMIGLNGSYTYPAGDPGLQNQAFPASGTSNVIEFIANSVGAEAMNWLQSSTAVSFVNRSMASTDQGGPYAVNWAARYDVILTTVAAGNGGLTSAVVNNEAYFNALMVGSYRYETWDNPTTHRRASTSSYVNDTSEYVGQERPHILGPGAHMDGFGEFAGLNIPDIAGDNAGRMRTASYALDGAVPVEATGTSFAAPAVLSVAIQAYQYEGLFSYLYYPIMRKAVILASAVDVNADGEVGKGAEWTSSPDAEDGAGRPDLARLKELLDGNQYAYAELTDSMFIPCGTGCRKYTLTSFSVDARRSVKAALVWNACPIAAQGRTFSAADLDLVLVRPAACGGTLHQSVSVGNELEMIFDRCLTTSKTPGTYTVEVRIKNGGTLPATCGPVEPVAFAWSIR